jgi:hypothetical protein
MNNEHESPKVSIDRRVGSWVSAGPDRAPEGLLTTALHRTADVRQRPRWLAVAGGAPTAGAIDGQVTPLRVAVVVALIVLTMVAIAVVVGLPRPNQLVVVPTPVPSTRPTPPRTQLPSPEPSFAPDFDTGFDAVIVQDQLQPWSRVEHRTSENPRRTLAGNQLVVIYGGCPIDCADMYGVDVTFGTAEQGLVVNWLRCRPGTESGLPCAIEEAETGGIPEFVQGDDTAALAAAWMARYGDAPATTHVARDAEWTILHYPSRVVALLVRLDQAAVVSLDAHSGQTTGQRETFVAHFLDLVMFTTPLPLSTAGPRAAIVGDIEVNIPAGWTLADGPGVKINHGGGFFTESESFYAIDPGGTLFLYRSSDDREGFTVGGATIGELVRSIDIGMGSSGRSDVTIAGTAGYRWFPQNMGLLRPIVAMTAFEWRGRFYVFVVTYPIEAAPADPLGPNDVTLH